MDPFTACRLTVPVPTYALVIIMAKLASDFAAAVPSFIWAAYLFP